MQDEDKTRPFAISAICLDCRDARMHDIRACKVFKCPNYGNRTHPPAKDALDPADQLLAHWPGDEHRKVEEILEPAREREVRRLAQQFPEIAEQSWVEPTPEFTPSKMCWRCRNRHGRSEKEALGMIIHCQEVTCYKWPSRLVPDPPMADAEEDAMMEEAAQARDKADPLDPASLAAKRAYKNVILKHQRKFRTDRGITPVDIARRVRDLWRTTTHPALKAAAGLQLRIVQAWHDAGLWPNTSVKDNPAVARLAVERFQDWMENPRLRWEPKVGLDAAKRARLARGKGVAARLRREQKRT